MLVPWTLPQQDLGCPETPWDRPPMGEGSGAVERNRLASFLTCGGAACVGARRRKLPKLVMLSLP